MSTTELNKLDQSLLNADHNLNLSPSPISIHADPDRKIVEEKDAAFTNEEVKKALGIHVKDEERPTVSADAVIAGDSTIDLDE